MKQGEEWITMYYHPLYFVLFSWPFKADSIICRKKTFKERHLLISLLHSTTRIVQNNITIQNNQ